MRSELNKKIKLDSSHFIFVCFAVIFTFLIGWVLYWLWFPLAILWVLALWIIGLKLK